MSLNYLVRCKGSATYFIAPVSPQYYIFESYTFIIFFIRVTQRIVTELHYVIATKPNELFLEHFGFDSMWHNKFEWRKYVKNC